ncbi:hypothetical protein [Brevundimonas sp. R86498]|uniref:hypothetical protein n=1 Tax=Brevundimonas sp. R86498 TaxID=3093845 RepID=UPI0037C70F27
MNDPSLAKLLADLDAELARKNDVDAAARDVLACVVARAPGAVMRSAASQQLRALGCPPSSAG